AKHVRHVWSCWIVKRVKTPCKPPAIWCTRATNSAAPHRIRRSSKVTSPATSVASSRCICAAVIRRSHLSSTCSLPARETRCATRDRREHCIHLHTNVGYLALHQLDKWIADLDEQPPQIEKGKLCRIAHVGYPDDADVRALHAVFEKD